LDFEESEGHLGSVGVGEVIRVRDDSSVVGDLRQEFSRWEDGLGDVVFGQRTASAGQGDIVCVGEGLSSCEVVREGQLCRVDRVGAYRSPRREQERPLQVWQP
jgi:hypothetical protein